MSTQHALASIADRVEDEIGKFEKTDYLRLYRKLSYLLPGTRYQTSIDLFNEAIFRTLDGRRVWPTEVAFEPYIIMVAKSISHGQRNLSSQKQESLAIDLVFDDEDENDVEKEIGVGLNFPGSDTDIDQRDSLERAQVDLDAITEQFQDDDAVQLVIMAIEDGIPPRELEAEFGMSLNQYESARKKLRRAADRIFPGRRIK